MAKDNKKLVFRRVRGRIIPIRVSAPDIAGASAVAAGVAGAVAAGREANHLVRKAASFENAARNIMNIRPVRRADLFRFSNAERLLKKRHILFKRRNPTLLAGAAIAGGLTAIGAGLLGRNKKKKENFSIENAAKGFAFGAILPSFAYYAKFRPAGSTITGSLKAAFELAKKRSSLKNIIKGI